MEFIDMPRFVILEHDHPQLHWDFMLEAGEILRTWKLLGPPGRGKIISAELSFDHRLIYLDYEGPISNNRGSVIQKDSGTFVWLLDTDNHVQVDLSGKHFSGTIDFICQSGKNWQVTFI